MDITPPQFNALLRELKKIREHLEELRKDKEQENAAGNETQEREKEQGCKLPVPLEIKFEEDQATEYKTETGKQQSTQNSIRKATWGAFIAASVYAIITIGIAIISLYQLKDAHQNFVDEQRPYVVVEDYALHSFIDYKPITQPIFSAGFSVELHFRNAGKTPALRAVFQCHVVSDIEKIKPDPLERNQGEGEPIPQGGSVTRSAVYEAPYETGPVFAFGRVIYYDFAGNIYCTPYMKMLEPTGEWGYRSGVTKHSGETVHLADLCSGIAPY